jgi:hypothetical protein
MDIGAIKNDRNFFWTNHSKYKLLQYGLSPSMVKKVLNHPERIEEGIAPKTTATMKRKDSKKNKREVWVMHQKFGSKKKIISAWIYPGVSPKGKNIYVPEEVWEELV